MMKAGNTQAMKPQVFKRIKETGVVAVLVIDEVKHALPLADALQRGGVDAIELTLRTPVALEAAKAIKKHRPDICLGIGTVLTAEQVKAVAGIGADFAVAPGCNPRVIAEAARQNLSFAPGVMTPSDIEMALEHACKTVKYFPAESAGGIKHLENILGPYQHLGISVIPLGGLNILNVAPYLKSQSVLAIGGSWLAKRPEIMAENWETITKNAKEIRSLIIESRK